MSMKELMAAGNSLPTGDTPEGVSFDGTNDYLSRSSDLTGNADGKTFTFSAWVYWNRYQGTVYSMNTASTYDIYELQDVINYRSPLQNSIPI